MTQLILKIVDNFSQSTDRVIMLLPNSGINIKHFKKFDIKKYRLKSIHGRLTYPKRVVVPGGAGQKDAGVLAQDTAGVLLGLDGRPRVLLGRPVQGVVGLRGLPPRGGGLLAP